MSTLNQKKRAHLHFALHRNQHGQVENPCFPQEQGDFQGLDSSYTNKHNKKIKHQVNIREERVKEKIVANIKLTTYTYASS